MSMTSPRKEVRRDEKLDANPALDTIEKERKQVQDELRVLDAKRHALRTRLNARITICTLPVEVVAEILALLVAADFVRPLRRRKLGWILATHVCWYWRSVALTTPRLWTNLDARLGLRWTNEMLVRSSNNPLTVDVSHRPYEVIKALCEPLSRIKSLTFRHDKFQMPNWMAFLTQPAPLLENLELVAESGDLDFRHLILPLPTPFLGSSAPRLSSIFFRNVVIPWGSPIFSKTVTYCMLSLPDSTDPDIIVRPEETDFPTDEYSHTGFTDDELDNIAIPNFDADGGSEESEEDAPPALQAAVGSNNGYDTEDEDEEDDNDEEASHAIAHFNWSSGNSAHPLVSAPLVPSYPELLDMLARMPMLRILELDHAIPAASGSPQGRKVTLSHLTKLKVKGIARDCLATVSFLDIPHTAFFHMCCIFEDLDAFMDNALDLLVDVLVERIQACATNKRPIRAIHLRPFGFQGLTIAASCHPSELFHELHDSPHRIFKLEAYHGDGGEWARVSAMTEVLSMLPLATCKRLVISAFGKTLSPDDWLEILGTQTQIEEVHVTVAAMAFTEALVDGLEEEGADPETPLFLPNLKILEIRTLNFNEQKTRGGGLFWKRLLDVLEKRGKRGAMLHRLDLRMSKAKKYDTAKLRRRKIAKNIISD